MSIELHHPCGEEIELSAVLHALSDPQRLQIVRLLAAQEQAVPCGSLRLEIAKSTATHHFRVLREAGVIRQAPYGTSKLTSLRRADLDARLPGLLDAVLAASAPPHRAEPPRHSAEPPPHSAGPPRHGAGPEKSSHTVLTT